MIEKDIKQALCIESRKIIIDRDIDENSVLDWFFLIDKIICYDEDIGVKEPIEIVINTNGGDVYSGLALANQIEWLKSIGYTVITTNLSKAFSMGCIIALLGTKRRCYRYSSYMIHDVSSISYGKIKEMNEQIEETKRLYEILKSIILANSSIPEVKLDEWIRYKTDKFLSANEALEFKMVDEIL